MMKKEISTGNQGESPDLDLRCHLRVFGIWRAWEANFSWEEGNGMGPE
jgi:hypothetical protein